MSNYTLEEFKNYFKEMARPNRFKAYFYPDGGNGEFLSVMVKKVNMPQLTMQEFVIERAGKKLHIPTHADFGDLSVTFFNEEKHLVKKMMYGWQQSMVYNWISNTLPPVLTTLQGKVEVYQLDSKFNQTAGMRFTNCWPKNISNIDFGHDLENQVSDFTVDFVYTNQEII